MVYDLKFELQQQGHTITKFHRSRKDPSIFILTTINPEKLKKLQESTILPELLSTNGFTLYQSQYSKPANPRTVHVKNLDSNFFYPSFGKAASKSFQECKDNLLTELQENHKAIENIHILGFKHLSHESLPTSMQVLFSSRASATNWLKIDTELSHGTILSADKVMHHNISMNICSNCRSRDCNKKCSGPKLCANCLGDNHTAANCSNKSFCNNCKSGDHVTNSNTCPVNRKYIKDILYARKQDSSLSSSFNAWTKKPKIAVMDPQKPMMSSAKPQDPVPLPQNPWRPWVDKPKTAVMEKSAVMEKTAVMEYLPKTWLLGLMYAAIACKSNSYCIQTFHTTHAAFCSKNNMVAASLPDPTPKMIDDLASGDYYATKEDIPEPITSQHPSTDPKVITPKNESLNLPSVAPTAEAEPSTSQYPENNPEVTSPEEDSPILPSVATPAEAESSSSQHTANNPEVTSVDSPNLPSAARPAEVESSTTDTSNSSLDLEEISISSHSSVDTHSKDPKSSSESQFTAKDFPSYSSSEFIKCFARHHKEFDLSELAEDISKLQTIRPLTSLKDAFINLSEDCQDEYLKFLMHLGSINYGSLDETLYQKAIQQMEILKKGISLSLVENTPRPACYGKQKASGLRILVDVESHHAVINYSYKKIRSALFKALWVGLIDTEFPIVWEENPHFNW